MKRYITSIFMATLILSVVVVATAYILSQRVRIYKPPEQIIESGLPILFLVDEEQVYNPMVPYKNEIDAYEVGGSISLWESEGGPGLILSNNDIEALKYELIDPVSQNILDSGSIDLKSGAPYGNGLQIQLPKMMLLTGTSCVLKLEGVIDGQPLYYYQKLQIEANFQRQALSLAQKCHVAMLAGDKDISKWIKGLGNGGSFYEADENASVDILLWKGMSEKVKMNEPIPIITDYDLDQGTIEVALHFTVANRSNHEFAYWTFEEVYEIQIDGKETEIIGFSRTGNRQHESIYDEASGQWILDEGAPLPVKGEMTSNNGAYQAFVYKETLYMLEMGTNTLYQVMAFDQLDDDYILDEHRDFGIKLLALSDEGELDYIVYGYMAGGELQGFNGIQIRTYMPGGINKTMAFMETAHTTANIEEAFRSRTYWDGSLERYFFTLENQLYGCDFMKGEIGALLALDESARFLRNGIIYWQDSNKKDNMGLRMIDLKDPGLEEKKWFYLNRNIRVVDSGAEGLLVGTYQEKMTFEYLDGSLFYPYDRLAYLNRDGYVLEEIVAPPQQYFSDVMVDGETQAIGAGLYRLDIATASDPRNSRIRYAKVEDKTMGNLPAATVRSKQEGMMAEGMLTQSIQNEGTKQLRTAYAGDAKIDQVQYAKDAQITVSQMKLDKRIRTGSLYEAYVDSKRTGTWTTYQDTFTYIRNNPKSILYQLKPDGTRNLVYDGAYIETPNRLDVPTLSQKPELMRGCEVTSLAMFLSYCLDVKIIKMSVADRLIMDLSDYDDSQGWVKFGNMHRGFVGSLTDRSKPGLGVYIEPIHEMASEYIEEGLVDITGAGLDQMLYFLSKGSPVLVITPMTYTAITENQTEHWETPWGFMEVTYKEHAVVLVGYDETYVYFNDPLTGSTSKRSREQFAAGLDSMGRQGLTVWP